MAIRVLFYGLGPIGAAVARQVASRKGFQIVGAVDIDRNKIGRDLGEVIGLEKKLKVRVTNDAIGAIKAGKPDVAVICTSSSLKQVMPQIQTVLAKKVAIVSTTEELSYPVGKNRALAKKIDALAKKAKVAVVGTGVNPGFAMDALPITLTGICERVDSIRVDRIQDARTRRLPFQQKIGAGLTKEQFAQKVKDGSVRHVGLAESVTMIADAMGWKLDKVTDEIQPKIAEQGGRKRAARGRPRLRLRDHPGRHRLQQGQAGGDAPHGSVPGRARVVRRRHGRGQSRTSTRKSPAASTATSRRRPSP